MVLKWPRVTQRRLCQLGVLPVIGVHH
jgi:hypothetical protein